MFADVTVITLDGLHKTLLWAVLILSIVTWLFWKFGGGKKSRPRNIKQARKRKAGAQVRKALRPALKSKTNNAHPRNLTDIR